MKKHQKFSLSFCLIKIWSINYYPRHSLTMLNTDNFKVLCTSVEIKHFNVLIDGEKKFLTLL